VLDIGFKKYIFANDANKTFAVLEIISIVNETVAAFVRKIFLFVKWRERIYLFATFIFMFI
jgi:hypothetical protein